MRTAPASRRRCSRRQCCLSPSGFPPDVAGTEDRAVIPDPCFPSVSEETGDRALRRRGRRTHLMHTKKRLRDSLRKAFRGLWLSRDFRRLWASLTITSFGAQITNLALPLTAALLLHATPMQMGILVALETLPFALVSLHA